MIENLEWLNYQDDHQVGFGHGAFRSRLQDRARDWARRVWQDDQVRLDAANQEIICLARFRDKSALFAGTKPPGDTEPTWGRPKGE